MSEKKVTKPSGTLEANKVDRPEGTFAKKFKVVMDIKALPKMLDMATFARLTDMGYIIYDSSTGNRPKLYAIDGDTDPKSLVAFVDTKGKDVDLELWQKKYDEEEFWRKELYKCKQSPIYHFVNYISTSPKPTQKEITEYLHKVNMGPTNDSVQSGEEAQEKLKRVREEYAATVKLEDLKNMKPVRDSITAEYEAETEQKMLKAASELGMVGKEKGDIVAKIIAAILKTSPKDTKGKKLEYYTVRNNPKMKKWDRALLKATDPDIIVRLWEETLS